MVLVEPGPVPMTMNNIPVLLLLACLLVSTGCTQVSSPGNRTLDASGTPAPVANYQRTIAQPEDSARMIRMDTDVYNIGEVVEFVMVNEKPGALSCTRSPPEFLVRYQISTGTWVTRMGGEDPAPGNGTSLMPGESTRSYRFVTTGWAPGRYRIVSDCGVSREFLLRALPSATPSGTSCQPATGTTPFIQVNPISGQYPGKTFTISGTTSLAAGDELQYSIFAILPVTGNITPAKLVSGVLRVARGSCGTNTWSVDGQITVPGEYFIGISDRANTLSAIKRFTVFESDRPSATATLLEDTRPPGITTG